MISTAVPGAGLPCASVTGKVTVTVSVPLAGAWSLATTAVPGVPTPGTKFISIVCVLLLITAVILLTPAFVLVTDSTTSPLASVVPLAGITAPLSALKAITCLARELPFLSVTIALILLISSPLAIALSDISFNAPPANCASAAFSTFTCFRLTVRRTFPDSVVLMFVVPGSPPAVI